MSETKTAKRLTGGIIAIIVLAVCLCITTFALNELKPKDIKVFVDYLTTSGRCDGKGGLSQITARKILSLVRSALNQAVLEDLLKYNPAIGIKVDKSQFDINRKNRTVFMCAEDAQKMLNALQGHYLLPMVYVTLYYGLRKSEVLGLRWQDIDFEKNTIRLYMIKVGT